MKIRKTEWYYKTKDGHGWLMDTSKHDDENLIEITKAEWDEHVASIHHEPSAAQLAKIQKRKQISEARAYLSSTDYVVIKIAEETDADKIGELRETYADVIAERKAKRALINELLK